MWGGWRKQRTHLKETPKDTYTHKHAYMHTCTYQDKRKHMLSKRRATVQLIDQVNHPSSLGIQRNTQITPFVEILFIPRFVLSISISIYPAFIPVPLSSHNVEHHEQAVCPLSTSQPWFCAHSLCVNDKKPWEEEENIKKSKTVMNGDEQLICVHHLCVNVCITKCDKKKKYAFFAAQEWWNREDEQMLLAQPAKTTKCENEVSGFATTVREKEMYVFIVESDSWRMSVPLW